MSLSTKDTSKLVVALQAARDQLEQAGDLPGSQNITTAIASVILASEDAEQPAPSEDELSALKFSFNTAPDLRTRSYAQQALIVKEARIAAYGNRPLRRVKSDQQLAKRGKG